MQYCPPPPLHIHTHTRTFSSRSSIFFPFAISAQIFSSVIFFNLTLFFCYPTPSPPSFPFPLLSFLQAKQQAASTDTPPHEVRLQLGPSHTTSGGSGAASADVVAMAEQLLHKQSQLEVVTTEKNSYGWQFFFFLSFLPLHLKNSGPEKNNLCSNDVATDFC